MIADSIFRLKGPPMIDRRRMDRIVNIVESKGFTYVDALKSISREAFAKGTFYFGSFYHSEDVVIMGHNSPWREDFLKKFPERARVAEAILPHTIPKAIYVGLTLEKTNAQKANDTVQPERH